MQAIEKENEVVAPGELGRARDLEAYPVGQACRAGSLPRPLDRAGVIVEADDVAGRIGLGQQQRRDAMAAAHVGDARSRLELFRHARQSGNPCGGQVRRIGRQVEPLHARKDVLILMVVRHARSGPERMLDMPRRMRVAEGELEGAAEKHRARFVGQDRRVLIRKREAAGRAVIGDVAAGGLLGQPFPDVALGRSRPCGELRRRQRPGAGHGLVKTQPVAQHHHRQAHGGDEIVEGALDESACRLLLCHRCHLLEGHPA